MQAFLARKGAERTRTAVSCLRSDREGLGRTDDVETAVCQSCGAYWDPRYYKRCPSCGGYLG